MLAQKNNENMLVHPKNIVRSNFVLFFKFQERGRFIIIIIIIFWLKHQYHQDRAYMSVMDSFYSNFVNDYNSLGLADLTLILLVESMRTDFFNLLLIRRSPSWR